MAGPWVIAARKGLMVAFMAVGHSPLLGLAGIALGARVFDCKSVSQAERSPNSNGQFIRKLPRGKSMLQMARIVPNCSRFAAQPESEVVGRHDCNAPFV